MDVMVDGKTNDVNVFGVVPALLVKLSQKNSDFRPHILAVLYLVHFLNTYPRSDSYYLVRHRK